MSLAVSARSPICHQMTSDMRDWAALDDGPAGLIADRLLAHDVADYVRFRSMCRTWRRCSADPRAHCGLDRRFHPRRWVMLQERLGTPNSRCFINTFTGQCIQVDLPELRNHYMLAHTPEGLLVVAQKLTLTTVHLLNPFTRHLIELPPLTTFLPQEEHHLLSHDNIQYLGAWGSGIASDSDHSTVVLCFYNLGLLGVAKPGHECWTIVSFDNRLQTSPLMFAGDESTTDDGGSQPVSVMFSSHLVDNAGELMLVHGTFEWDEETIEEVQHVPSGFWHQDSSPCRQQHWWRTCTVPGHGSLSLGGNQDFPLWLHYRWHHLLEVPYR